MSLISIISLAVAILVLAASPGPGVFATVAKSIASGLRPAINVITGIVIGDVIFLIFAIYGLSIIANILGDLFFIIKILGGIYLFWSGLKIWLSKPSNNDSDQRLKTKSRFGDIFSGLFITLSNPKVIIFYCSFLPSFIDLSILKPIDIALIIFVVAIVLSSVLIIYALAANYTRQIFSSQKSIKRSNYFAGGAMMATGVVIATRS